MINFSFDTYGTYNDDEISRVEDIWEQYFREGSTVFINNIEFENVQKIEFDPFSATEHNKRTGERKPMTLMAIYRQEKIIATVNIFNDEDLKVRFLDDVVTMHIQKAR